MIEFELHNDKSQGFSLHRRHLAIEIRAMIENPYTDNNIKMQNYKDNINLNISDHAELDGIFDPTFDSLNVDALAMLDIPCDFISVHKRQTLISPESSFC